MNNSGHFEDEKGNIYYVNRIAGLVADNDYFVVRRRRKFK